MTVTVISTSSTASGYRFTATANGDGIYIAPGVVYASSDSAPINAASFRINVDIGGSLVSAARLVDGFAAGMDIHVAKGGSYTSFMVSSFSFASRTGNSGQMVNEGAIVASNAIAVSVDDDAFLNNSGSIRGATGVFMGVFGGAGSRFINSGDVTANAYDDATNNVRYNNAVMMEGVDGYVLNLAGGLLSGTSSEGAGLRIQGNANNNLVENYGVITSMQDWGVNFSGVTAGAFLNRLNNWGSILGGDGAFFGSGNTDTVTNRGVLTGKVDMGLGADVFDNRDGRIEGDVDLGDGVDSFDNLGGVVNGTVLGGAGNDTFRLGAGIEFIDGGADIDAIDFRGTPAVQVSLDGSVEGAGHAAGDEYSGIENIYGSYYDDLLVGGVGANTLRGYGGNDVMNGGAGADKMVGGNGIDTMTGGAGVDTFVYDKLSEIGDLITDFNGAGDLFNIRATAFGGGLVAGTLGAALFQSRADNAAQDADDRFIFRTTDRTLWFDVDGNAAGAAVMVADLQAGASVSATNIVVI